MEALLKTSWNTQDIKSITDLLGRESVDTHEQIEQFEKKFTESCESLHAVAFSSLPLAVIAVYSAIQMNSNDKIFLSPFASCSLVAPALLFGGVPVFIDVIKESGLINLNQLDYNLSQSRLGCRHLIIASHFYGIPLDLPKLEPLIKDPEIIIIEDAISAFGSSYPSGKKIGSTASSNFTIFSLADDKLLAANNAAVVTTHSESWAEKLRFFRNGGEEGELGCCSLPSSFQAALGISQLDQMKEKCKKRGRQVSNYRRKHTLFEGPAPRQTVYDPPFAIKGKGVTVKPVYHHPYYREKFGDLSEYFPVTESLAKKLIPLV